MTYRYATLEQAIDNESISYYYGLTSENRIAHRSLSSINQRVKRAFQLLYALVALFVIFGCATNDSTQSSHFTNLNRGNFDLRVDHAWVKNADSAEEKAAQRKLMETLREKIEEGGTFVASWNTLSADGTYWHVAENETYAADVLPEGARNLDIGTLSPILPGDGGLHLFRILGREPSK